MKEFIKKILVRTLIYLSRITIKKYKPKIIMVAGSVGKTSTKDAIYTVLNTTLPVWKSKKSYNSEIGVPLTILGLENAWNNPFLWLGNILKGLELVIFKKKYPKYLILEVGSDRPDDIKNIVSWLIPDVSVVTRFGEVPVHVEFFEDRNQLISEDGMVVSALRRNGLLVLNNDDEDVMGLKDKSSAKTLTYGFDSNASVVVSNIQIIYDNDNNPIGTTCKIDFEGTSAPLRIIGAIGKAQIYACLPALLVGNHFGINLISGVEALSTHQTPPGRLKIIKGIKNTTIIDDTYNSSPVAVEEALSSVAQISTKGKRIAVLGDMMELGKNSEEEHKRIGRLAGKMCEILVTVGIRSRGIAEGALQAGLSESNIQQFETAQSAGDFVEGIISSQDIILVKGSQSTRMERIVEEIMENPIDAQVLLVRQDSAWKIR